MTRQSFTTGQNEPQGSKTTRSKGVASTDLLAWLDKRIKEGEEMLPRTATGFDYGVRLGYITALEVVKTKMEKN